MNPTSSALQNYSQRAIQSTSPPANQTERASPEATAAAATATTSDTAQLMTTSTSTTTPSTAATINQSDHLKKPSKLTSLALTSNNQQQTGSISALYAPLALVGATSQTLDLQLAAQVNNKQQQHPQQQQQAGETKKSPQANLAIVTVTASSPIGDGMKASAQEVMQKKPPSQQTAATTPGLMVTMGQTDRKPETRLARAESSKSLHSISVIPTIGEQTNNDNYNDDNNDDYMRNKQIERLIKGVSRNMFAFRGLLEFEAPASGRQASCGLEKLTNLSKNASVDLQDYSSTSGSLKPTTDTENYNCLDYNTAPSNTNSPPLPPVNVGNLRKFARTVGYSESTTSLTNKQKQCIQNQQQRASDGKFGWRHLWRHHQLHDQILVRWRPSIATTCT